MIRNPGSHRRCHADGFVNAAEVIKSEPARDRRPVVPLLAEGVRKASEAPRAHPYGQILALHDTGADALRVGLTEDWDYLNGLDFSGRVARFAVAGGAVDLDELGEAGQPIMQRRGDRRAVGSEAVRCDLKRSPRRRVADAFDKNIRGRLVALAHRNI